MYDLGTSVSPADAAVLALLRAIRRDVAHDLRGPVQSVVVNTEVVRRRIAAGDHAGAADRVDVMEEEVRRMHAVADAFLALARPLTTERRVFDAGSVLDQVEPLLRTLARSARVSFVRQDGGAAPLVRSNPEALALALVRAAIAVNGAAGPGGGTALVRRIEPAALVLEFRPDPEPGVASGPGPASGLEEAAATATLWLSGEDGTVECPPVSDGTGTGAIRIRLPRADIA